MNLTQKELADAIQVPYQRTDEIVSGKRGVTPSTASDFFVYQSNCRKISTQV